MPPPESSIFMGDHIMGLMLIKLIVERHFIQETIYLPTCREKNKKPDTHLAREHVQVAHLAFCSFSQTVCTDSQTSYKPTTRTLLELPLHSLPNLHRSSIFNSRSLPPPPPTPDTASPEEYGLYYSNDIYYTSPGFISYLFLILLSSSNWY